MWTCPKCGREFKHSNQSHFCGDVSTIDAYIDEQPVEIRALLHKVRATIREAAPDAAEKISWGMPTFRLNENLIHFAAQKGHLGIYPGEIPQENPFEKRLAGYRRTKGAIQFPYDKPIDFELIADITRWRVQCVRGEV